MANVRLTQLFNKFLVLVQLLQSFSIHARNIICLSLVTMRGITKDADLELGSRNILELHSSTETLVLLRIVVLQADLELNCFNKLSFLVLGSLKDSTTALVKCITVELTDKKVNKKFNLFK